MNIKEIITEAGNANANQSSSFVKDVGDFAGKVGSDIYGAGELLGKAAKATVDPETYKQAGSDIKQGWEQLKKDPKQALKNLGQTTDDAMRSAANAATLGGADWVASKLGGTDLQTQQDLSQAAWERSPKASMAGAVGGSILDPVFLGGAKVGGKVASKLLPKAKSIPGKVASGGTKFGTATAGGFAADRAAADTIDSTVYENTELSDIQRLAGQSLDEGWKFSVPKNVHGLDTARLDPNVRDASYQERVRAAQQKKTAATASGDVDVNADPKYAAQQKQIQALSDKMAAQEKAAKDAKISKNIKRGVVGTGLVGGAVYLKNKLTPDSKWDNPEDDPFVKQYKADKSASDQTDKDQSPVINTTSTPQSTDTDNGDMFRKETFKTNESISELDRVKDLINYGKQR